MWDVVRNLELTGFRVLALTCDGVAYNRKFFDMHKKQGYKVKNHFAEQERDIHFFSDVPHLLKTARNCLANSFSHTRSRKLWVSIN